MSGNGITQARESPELQQVRSINLMLFSCANDNNQKYPDGKNSTEVFQKLIDGDYCSDPTVFYLPLPGKTKPIKGQKLKPENVSFDVTSGIDSTSPDLLPTVFMTGYRVTYAPSGTAAPIIKPYPQYGTEPLSWSEWWNGKSERRTPPPGIGVAYKNNSAVFFKLVDAESGNGVVPHFISPDFKPDGRTYRQLTPDGVLPP